MTIRYLIIDSQEDIYSGSEMDYVDYLLEMEYRRTPSDLIDIPASDELSHCDELGKSPTPPARGTPTGKLVY